MNRPVISPLWTIRTCAGIGIAASAMTIRINALFMPARYEKNAGPGRSAFDFCVSVADYQRSSSETVSFLRQ